MAAGLAPRWAKRNMASACRRPHPPQWLRCCPRRSLSSHRFRTSQTCQRAKEPAHQRPSGPARPQPPLQYHHGQHMRQSKDHASASRFFLLQLDQQGKRATYRILYVSDEKLLGDHCVLLLLVAHLRPNVSPRGRGAVLGMVASSSTRTALDMLEHARVHFVHTHTHQEGSYVRQHFDAILLRRSQCHDHCARSCRMPLQPTSACEGQSLQTLIVNTNQSPAIWHHLALHQVGFLTFWMP